METFFVWQLGLQFILILLNAIFACAEIAVLSLNEHKLNQLAEQKDKRAIQLIQLTEQPAKFLATIQVAITFSGFLASAFAADNFSDALVNFFIEIGIQADYRVLDAIAVVVITLILSYITLVFGELVPKRIAMKKSQALALGLSSILAFVAKITAPLVWLLTQSTNLVLRLIGINPHTDDESMSEEELIMMIDAGSQKGIIDIEEKNFINNVFEFDDLDMSQVLTHRTQLTVLWLEDSLEDWEKTMNETRHSRYLVCDDVIDNVVGVLRMRDFYFLEEKTKENVLNTCVKTPFYVPETAHADAVFRQMKKQRQQLAIVVDEYAGVQGIVTMTDLLEELVGEFDDEADSHLPSDGEDISLNDNVWHIRGYAALEDVMEKLEITLPIEEYQTFAGYVFALYGEIPEEDTSIFVETKDITIKVAHIKKRTFDWAYVTKHSDTIADILSQELSEKMPETLAESFAGKQAETLAEQIDQEEKTEATKE